MTTTPAPVIQIYYPFKPFTISQHWGNPNPAYSAQFGDPNFKRHNGVDATTYGGTAYGQTWWVSCPVEGFYVESITWEANGGGNQMSLVSKKKVRIWDKDCYARIYLCHAKKILVKEGYEPALGELIMMADNTGFSTGPHTHLGLYRLNDDFTKMDNNDSTGSFNPELYFTRTFAIDEATMPTLAKSTARYISYLVGIA